MNTLLNGLTIWILPAFTAGMYVLLHKKHTLAGECVFYVIDQQETNHARSDGHGVSDAVQV